MARPKKPGLSYFPMDVIIFSDREIRRLIKQHGHSGYVIFNYLLCLIYSKEGYFVRFDKDLAFDIADYLNTGLTETDVHNSVQTMLKECLFSVSCYEQHGILTSARIQLTYLEIKKTGVISEKYRVYDVITPINEAETPAKPPEIPQSKVKESKEKESKVNYFRMRGELIPSLISDFFPSNFATFLEQWQMKYDPTREISTNVLKEMNITHAGYSFQDSNHLQNTFKQEFQKLKNGTKKFTTATKGAVEHGTEFGRL